MKDINIHEWQAKYLREDSNKQQTAVEWLQSQISYKENGVDLFEDLFSKAKEIEKKQQGYSDEDMIEAFESGTVNQLNFTNKKPYQNAIEWFEQFKGNK